MYDYDIDDLFMEYLPRYFEEDILPKEESPIETGTPQEED